jgi:ppGpp synthetase/RelA/SpoT-type nucleotidyltranferase
MKPLEQEALEVRRGADQVQQHLLKLLDVGSPSVRDLAYAIKSRIKDDFKIVQKVKKKKQEKEYKVSDLRDIVGVRIVTLYRLDVLAILPILLERINRESGKDETKLLLENPIEEIKIYSVNLQGDAQNLATRVESIFKDMELGEKCVIEQKQENYTSIHMVIWARAKWNGVFLDIPVEVQLRTALEDVWSEMDHQLKYKKDAKGVDSLNTGLVANCLAHLNVMKTLNDGLAQYGDQVKIQIDHIDNSIKRRERTRLAEEPEKRLLEIEGYSGDLQTKVRDLLGRSRAAFQDGLEDLRTSTRRVKSLMDIDHDLERTIIEIPTLGASESLASELLYVFSMERALVNFEIGKRVGVVSSNDHYVTSQGIYLKVADVHPNRAIVQYRLARVLHALGQRPSAIEKMCQLIDRYDEYDLEPDHWVNASARRVLGFWHWEQAQRISSEPDAQIIDDDLGLVLKAARYSIEASKIQVDEPTTPLENSAESPRLMALNNALFFAVEYLESNGSWNELASIGITKEVFSSWAKELSQYEADGADFRHLNTLRRIALWDDRREDAARYASEAIRQLENVGVRDRGGATVEQHVLRRCHQMVSGC